MTVLAWILLVFLALFLSRLPWPPAVGWWAVVYTVLSILIIFILLRSGGYTQLRW